MSMVKPRPMQPKVHKPLARGFRPNNTIATISVEKANWRELYLKALAFQIWLDPLCRCCGKMEATEGHHPYLQSGANIMICCPICRPCHNRIHGNPNLARLNGWLRDASNPLT